MYVVLFVAFLCTATALSRSECRNDNTAMCRNKHMMGPHFWKMHEGTHKIKEKPTCSSGVAFRVWAPHATDVAVVPAGDVGGRWQQTPMTPEQGGTFYANVGGAQVGDPYVYQLQTPSGSYQRLDPRAQDIDPTSTSDWQYSVVHDPNFDWGNTSENSGYFGFPGPNNVVVYQVHIPTFSPEGTFDGAIAKLGYLQRLGVNGIEFLPTAVYRGDPSGWGYNPAAPYATMPQYGGYNGLKRFVKAANALGMGVILDLVWNHADGKNILQYYDGPSSSSHSKNNTPFDSENNGIYFYSDGRAETPWGPRFNYDSPEVTQYILDSVQMWLTEYHISGFRWDSTVCMRKGGDGKLCWESNQNIPQGWILLQKANTLAENLKKKIFGSLNADYYTTAEDDQGFDAITRNVNDKNYGIPGAPGGAGFDSQWGYPFYYGFVTELIKSDNSQIDMGHVSLVYSNRNDDGGDINRLMFTECHDMASNQNKGRIPSIVDPGGNGYKPSYWAQKKSMLGIAFVLTAPRYPMLFYGQEMLSYQTFNFPVPPALDWGLASANKGLVQFVSDLIGLRLNKSGTTSGLSGYGCDNILVVNDGTNKVIVSHRYTTGKQASTKGDSVVVVINMYGKDYNSFILRNMPSDGTWNIRFNGDLQSYSPSFGNFGANQTSVQVSGGLGSLMLPAFTVVVLSQ